MRKKIGNKKFEEKFDEICKQENQNKIVKKQTFNNNVKDRLVILDEQGNVISKKTKQSSKKHIDVQHKKTIDMTLVMIWIIFFMCVYLIYKM